MLSFCGDALIFQSLPDLWFPCKSSSSSSSKSLQGETKTNLGQWIKLNGMTIKWGWNKVFNAEMKSAKTSKRLKHKQPQSNLVASRKHSSSQTIGTSTVRLWHPLVLTLDQSLSSCSSWILLAMACLYLLSLGLFCYLLWSIRPQNLHCIIMLSIH